MAFFENAKQEGALAIADCSTCMKQNSKEARQSWACGYEVAAPPHIPVVPWDHQGRKHDPSEYDEDGKTRVQICAGYVCRLPEVLETARAYTHWKTGNLTAFCGNEPPHDRLLECIEILDGSVNAFQRWDMNKDKKS